MYSKEYVFDIARQPIDSIARRVISLAPNDGITDFDASVLMGRTFDIMPSYSTLPSHLKDWRGFRFGRMVVVEFGFYHVIKRSGKRPNVRHMWVCRCRCGRFEYRRSDRIKSHKNKENSLASCRFCSVARVAKEKSSGR